jgi:predicted SnoaL-like aldol condensation-catalyzing enzyme
MTFQILDHLDSDGRQSVFRFLKEFTKRHPIHRIFVISHISDPTACVGTVSVTVRGPTRMRRYSAIMADGKGVAFEGDA